MIDVGMRRRLGALLAVVAIVGAACGSSDETSTDDSAAVTTTASAAAPETTESDTSDAGASDDDTAAANLVSTAPAGDPITPADVQTLKALFDDEAYSGGQVAPRLVKWITPDSYLFMQFDPDGEVPLFAGLGVKGVFCSEAQPDSAGGSFPHFHQPDGAEYSDSHGGEAGAPGYWLSFIALDAFDARGRAVVPGIDYELSPTPAPDCGGDVPDADFEAPGETTLSEADLAEFVAFFDTDLLTGGQQAPRLYKSINEDIAIFIQLDAGDPAEATTIRYLGLSQRGVFCEEARPSADFTHYHQYDAAEYGDGHGGPAGETEGYWLAFVATHDFELLFPGQDPADARQVAPGIDRDFAVLDAPAC